MPERPRLPGSRAAVAGYADSGLPGGANVRFWEDCDRLPGPWTGLWYTELLPDARKTSRPGAKEQVLLVVSGNGQAVLDGERHEACAGDVFTCPAGTDCDIWVPETAREPMALLTVEAFPGSPQRRSGPQRIPLAARMSGCKGYRGGGHLQETRVAVAPLQRHLTGRWIQLTRIEVEGDGILGERNGDRDAGGYLRPFNASEILFTHSGVAEITADTIMAENKDRPGRRLCAGVPPGATVLVRNLSQQQPLLLASIEMGVPG